MGFQAPLREALIRRINLLRSANYGEETLPESCFFISSERNGSFMDNMTKNFVLAHVEVPGGNSEESSRQIARVTMERSGEDVTKRFLSVCSEYKLPLASEADFRFAMRKIGHYM